jgi:hypothetical protein
MKNIFSILVFMALAVNGWAATYNIGPGQTYETFTALEAAVVLAGDDIVDLGGGTFTETFTIQTSGTSGHYITIQNGTIDAEDTRTYGINQNNKSYIKLKSLIVKNTANANNICVYAGDNWIIEDLTVENGISGIAYISGANVNIDGLIASDLSTAVNLISVTGTTTLKNLVITEGKTGTSYGIRITGAGSAGLLAISNISIPNSGYTYGIKIDSGAWDAGSEISNLLTSGADNYGLYTTNCSNIIFSDINASHNDIIGIMIGTGSFDLTFIRPITNHNLDDGFDIMDGAYDITIIGGLSDYNGYPTPYDANNSGDGYSAHGAAYGIKQYFCSATNNYNAGFAHINTSAGELYYCTSAFNGDSSVPTDRAGIFINTTGDNATADAGSKSWKVKNCISYNDYPRNLWITAAALASDDIDFDYNSYLPLDDDVFASLDSGSSDISWATYSASYESNSSNEDGLVSSSGKLQKGSPCIDTATLINTIYTAGYRDPWGHQVLGLPNIGADQNYSTYNKQTGGGSHMLRIGSF